MIKMNIEKEHDRCGSSKHFPIEGNCEITVHHDTCDGRDIVRVIVDGRVEFEYDVNNPEKEIVGYSTPFGASAKGGITII
jgi:hypothetical protein